MKKHHSQKLNCDKNFEINYDIKIMNENGLKNRIAEKRIKSEYLEECRELILPNINNSNLRKIHDLLK
jgi:hypothetical protein